MHSLEVMRMKQGNKYRYTIQFGMESHEQIVVGEFLERMGNRKGQLIVEVMSAYLDAHPELTAPNTTVVLEIERPSVQKEFIKKAVLEILSSMDVQPTHPMPVQPDTPPSLIQYGVSEDDLDDMLKNIDMLSV